MSARQDQYRVPAEPAALIRWTAARSVVGGVVVVGGAVVVGAQIGSVTVIVNTWWVVIPAALITVTTRGYEPAVPAAGVPAMVTAPEDGVDVTPAGRVPVTNTVAVGVAAAETLTVPGWPIDEGVAARDRDDGSGHRARGGAWCEPSADFAAVGLEGRAGDGGAGGCGDRDRDTGGVGHRDLAVLHVSGDRGDTGRRPLLSVDRAPSQLVSG